MLDPSFISPTRTMIELPDIPNGTVMLKEIDQVPNPKYQKFREYLSYLHILGDIPHINLQLLNRVWEFLISKKTR